MSNTNSSDENLDRENGDDLEERLKGDSIGDTLYSEKWVLKTLMKLTEEIPKYSAANNEDPDVVVELNETLESDLCLLWDMSAEPDVATCLFHHDILDLIKYVISCSCAPRLSELAVGILANCCCQENIAQSILLDNELILIVIDLLVNNDSQTIVQAVRLLDTLLRCQSSEKNNILDNQKIWTCISFILQNSLHEELLCITSRLADILTSYLDTENYEASSQKLNFDEILHSIFECITQLRKENDSGFSKEIQSALDSLISVVYNLSRLDGMRRIVLSSEEIDQHLEAYLEYLSQRLKEANPEELAKLIPSLVMALTVYYIAMNPRRRFTTFELSANIGSSLLPLEHETFSQHFDDFRDIFGDCFRRMTHEYGAVEMLHKLDNLNVSDLSFVLRTAHRTASETLQQLLQLAANSNSCNKLTETWKSLS